MKTKITYKEIKKSNKTDEHIINLYNIKSSLKNYVSFFGNDMNEEEYLDYIKTIQYIDKQIKERYEEIKNDKCGKVD